MDYNRLLHSTLRELIQRGYLVKGSDGYYGLSAELKSAELFAEVSKEVLKNGNV